MTDLWSPLFFSLSIAAAATALSAVVGIALAHTLGRASFFGKSLVESVVVLPLVLPPTVVGYLLLVVFGRHGWVGSVLAKVHYSILFRPEGGIVAAAVVSLPLLYLPTKAAIAGIDPDLSDVARLMGAGRLGLFWHVTLPLARRGIAAGVLLAFGRAVGEFGATTMVMGSTADRQTLPIAIYTRTMDGELSGASSAVWVLSGMSLVIVLLCRPGVLWKE